jgi:hypothetical protein
MACGAVCLFPGSAESIKEGDKTLLDNSMVLFTSDLAMVTGMLREISHIILEGKEEVNKIRAKSGL